MSQHDKAVTYTTYLKVDELLSLHGSLSDGPEHDELLFITIHQVYECGSNKSSTSWRRFSQPLRGGHPPEPGASFSRPHHYENVCSANRCFGNDDSTAVRVLSARLSSASGFQSAQFRELEAVLGRRDHAGRGPIRFRHEMAEHLVPGSPARCGWRRQWGAQAYGTPLFATATTWPSHAAGRTECDVSLPWEAREDVQEVLIALHHNDPDPPWCVKPWSTLMKGWVSGDTAT